MFAGFICLFVIGILAQIAVQILVQRVLTPLEALCVSLAAVFLVISFTANAVQIKRPKFRIAIVDTGYDASLVTGPKLKLCQYGHFDFAKGTNTVGSSHPHGTYVASIIARELKDLDYCAIIYNVYVPQSREKIPGENLVAAFYKASFEDVVAINASYEGMLQSVAEREAIREAAKRVPRIFVAAGNGGLNLDRNCLSFPACFDIPNMIPVGALKADLSGRLNTSNYGSRVKLWFNGIYDSNERGTSFASPRALSSYVLSLPRN